MTDVMDIIGALASLDGPRVLYATAAGGLFFLLALLRGLRIEGRRRVRHAVLARWQGRTARPAPLWVVRLVWMTILLLVSAGVALLYWGAWGTLDI
jgi:hypothetical protein